MRTAKTRRLIVIALCALFVVAGLGYVTLWHADDPITPTMVEVKEGDSLTTIAKTLQGAGVIDSAFWFRSIVILRDGESSIKAGSYRFNHVEPEYETARRLMSGDYGILEWKVTVPEGFTAFDITARIASTTGLVAFDTKETDRLFIQHEGHLFPETYFINEVSTPEAVVKRMTDEFEKRIKVIGFDMEDTYEFYGKNYTGEEVLTMASIVEGEANTAESRRIVADILWRRLSEDHPLQVDATLQYITGRGSADLTLADLMRDHLYNTYTRAGLPPTPINNPGEDSIKAVLEPTANAYNYFLTGDDGTMYYALDFETHKRNKAKYIKE